MLNPISQNREVGFFVFILNIGEVTMDIGTGIALLGGAGLVKKLLGPTAEYIGEGIKTWTEKRVRNVNNIIEIALRKLGSKIDEGGQVPPKVLKHILDDGSFCDDELSAEYFGGVLASSRSEKDIDDRGSSLMKLVAGRSSFQIRTHYIFYCLVRKAFYPYRNFISPGTSRKLMRIYLPTSEYFEIMCIEEESSQYDYRMNVLTHSMNGLERDFLIKDFQFGTPKGYRLDELKYRFPEHPIREEELDSHGITFTPTTSGMELFIWAHGYGHLNHLQFLSEDLKVEPLADIQLGSLANRAEQQMPYGLY